MNGTSDEDYSQRHLPRPSARFIANKMLLKELCSTLLEMKKYGRAVESNADALVPLAADNATEEELKIISRLSVEISRRCKLLYDSLAKEAYTE